jgi:hypothetical protein
MRRMSKTTAMMMAMAFIALFVYQMIRSQSLGVASSVLFLGFLLMIAATRYAGRRAPRKALAALVLALICGAIVWSGAI